MLYEPAFEPDPATPEYAAAEVAKVPEILSPFTKPVAL